MPKSIDEIELVIFDTETTGLEPGAGDRIVEIAAVKLVGDRKISDFQSLVNPGRLISPAAFAVNKISTEMLKDAPTIQEVMPRFLNFVQDAPLFSYNAGFDMEFLNQELKITGIGAAEDIVAIDILKMARRLLPGLERYPLWFVANHLGVTSVQEHRASSDVEMTWQVFRRLKQVLTKKGITDFTSFAHLFGISPRALKDIHLQKSAEIQEAIDLGVSLKIKYLSTSSATVTEREVIPKEIREEQGRSYLVGYCCLRREERTFRIDSILHLEIMGKNENKKS